MHTDAPAALQDPAAHGAQEVANNTPSVPLNVPAGHGRQFPTQFPVVLQYDPAPHVVHTVAPAELIVPAMHVTHDEEYTDPDVALYVPAGHWRQSMAPDGRSQYDPAPHVAHDDAPASLNVPYPHGMHVALDVAPVAPLNVPLLHGLQAPDPRASLKVPAAQSTHVVAEVASVAELPVPRGHGVQAELPVPEAYVPALHDVQAAALVAPTALLALPAAHAVHVVDEVAPDAVLYVPAMHSEQAAAPYVAL